MKIFRNTKEIPKKFSSVVSTGTFDGIHKGHRSILNRMTTIAKEQGLQSVVITFEPHPRIALAMDDFKLKLLTTLDEKLLIFEQLGIDNVFVVDFTKEFAATPYEVYVKDFLAKALHCKYVVMGFNHHFGNKRSGNHETLLEMGKMYGYQVEEIAGQSENNIVASSTKIRHLIENHAIEEANAMLTYHYSITGEVVEGRRIGRTIGFPTANIKMGDSLKLIPGNGVYGVKVEVDGTIYNGMCNIGYNPTFANPTLSVEVNIFDFDRDIYGQTIKVIFENYIRSEVKFDSVPELIHQLNRDKEMVLKKLYE